MSVVLVLGLLMNAIILPIAGKRVFFLFKLITSGQPAPDRVEGVTSRIGSSIKTQVVEVFGQKSSSSGPSRALHTSSSSGHS